MTVYDFITEIEKYYGKYDSDHRREVVREYLRLNIKENEINKLYLLTLENFSTQYGKVPDIAVFTRIINQYNDEHGEWYRYADGRVEWIGEGIGITKPDRERIDSPGVKRIEERTGQYTT